jgi:hypothetical protein
LRVPVITYKRWRNAHRKPDFGHGNRRGV